MSTKISKGSIIASFIYEKSTNLKGYEEMDLLTINEVKKNDGYLGHELFNSNEKNIFISYWKDMKSIEKWKNNSLHIKAKRWVQFGISHIKFKFLIFKMIIS